MADAFNFELVSPERLLFSEQVTAVVVPGSDGYFTVMANHAPLMSTIRPGVVEVTLADGGLQKLFVRGGYADDQWRACGEAAVSGHDGACEYDGRGQRAVRRHPLERLVFSFRRPNSPSVRRCA